MQGLTVLCHVIRIPSSMVSSRKCLRVSEDVMRANHSPYLCNGPTCKSKWNQFIPDYKKIADYHSRTGRNTSNYWDLENTDHVAKGLPKTFSQDIYKALDEWYRQRPKIQPPDHVRVYWLPQTEITSPIGR